MTLIEVLVAVLILAVGLLGLSVLQLSALKYTDRARMTSQASTGTASVRDLDLDLHDFEANILEFAGENAKGSVAISANEVTVSISW